MGINQFKLVCGDSAIVMMPPLVTLVELDEDDVDVVLLVFVVFEAVELELVPQPVTVRINPVERAPTVSSERLRRLDTDFFGLDKTISPFVLCVVTLAKPLCPLSSLRQSVKMDIL
jgi:hypothetical protein